MKRQKEESVVFSEEELAWMLDVVSQAQKDLRLFGMRGQERLILELMVIKLIKQSKYAGTPETVKPPVADRKPATDKKPITAEHPVNVPIPAESAHGIPAGEKKPMTVEAPTGSGTGVPEIELSIEEIQRRWTDVVEAMKKEKISLSHFLVGGMPGEIKDGVLSVVFTKEVSFHKERAEERENRDIIEKILHRVYGRKLKVKFIPGKGKVDTGPHQPSQQSEDPVVKKIIDLFNAKIVDRKKI